MTSPIVQDTVVGASAVGLGVWLKLFETSVGLFILVGGAALLIMRLWLTYREIKDKLKES